MSYKLRSAEQFHGDTLSPDKGTGYFHEISFANSCMDKTTEIIGDINIVQFCKVIDHPCEKQDTP